MSDVLNCYSFLYTQDFAEQKSKSDYRTYSNISESDLLNFSKDGEYIQRMLFKIEKMRRIGF